MPVTRVNFSLRGKDGQMVGRTAQASYFPVQNWNRNENIQTITNEEDGGANLQTGIGLGENSGQVLTDVPATNGPVANLKSLASLFKPKMITRDQYSKKKDDTPKPKIILIL